MDDFTQGAQLGDPFSDQKSIGEHPVATYADFEKKANIMLQLTTKQPMVIAKTPSGEEFQVEVVTISKNKRLDGKPGEQNVVVMKIMTSSDAIPAKRDVDEKYQSDFAKAVAKLAVLESDKHRAYDLIDQVTKTVIKKNCSCRGY